MKALLAVLLAALPLLAGSMGTFRGTVVERREGWVLVQGRNGMSRAVKVSAAKVTYGELVPAAARKKSAAESVRPGAELRVTAEQDGSGEWVASEIEVVGVK